MPIPLLAGLAAGAAGFVGRLAGAARATYLGVAAVWAMILATAPKWLPHVLGTALVALGINFVVVKPALGWIIGEISSRFAAAGPVVYVLYYLNVDDFVAITLSAMAIRMATMGSVQVRKLAQGATP